MVSITKLYWERANLHIELSGEPPFDVFLAGEGATVPLNKNGNKIIIPVYNTPEGTMLPAGTWRLICGGENILLSEKLIEQINSLSRNFLYRERKFAYLVNFILEPDGALTLETRFMRENRHPERFYRLSDLPGISGKIKTALIMAGLWALRVYYRFIHLFHIKNSILFLSENSDTLNGNLKALYECANSDEYRVRVFANNIYCGKKNSMLLRLKEVTALALSRVVIVDDYTMLLTHIQLAKGVKLVQLWHAGMGFKALGYARFGLNGSPHPYRSCHRQYTRVFVDKENLIPVYAEVFGCRKEIFRAVGMPRLEGYLEPGKYLSAADRLYKDNPLLKSEKTILFAPTFRGRSHEDAYYDYSVLDFGVLYDFLERNGFVMLIKMHPFIKEKPEIPESYRDRIFDYSSSEINDLIYISDIMITDYSSCAYEFSMFNRPLIFFRYDKAAYEYERQVYTLDVFSKKQCEVQTFGELMSTLEAEKDNLPADRFSQIEGTDRRDVCKAILADIFGDLL